MNTRTTFMDLKRFSYYAVLYIGTFIFSVNSRGAEVTANLEIQSHKDYPAAVDIIARGLVDNGIAICIARTPAVGETRRKVEPTLRIAVDDARRALQVMEYYVVEVLRGDLDTETILYLDHGDWDMTSKSVGYNYSGRGEHSLLFTKPAESPSVAKLGGGEVLKSKVGEAINDAIFMEATGQKAADWKQLLRELGLDAVFTNRSWVKLTPSGARLRIGLPPFSVEKDPSWELNREHYEAGLRRSKEIDVMLKTLILEKELVDDIKLLLNRGVDRLGSFVDQKIPADISAVENVVDDILDLEKELKSLTARDVAERIVERALKVSTVPKDAANAGK